MSKFIEYQNLIFKISYKILSQFNNYNIEEQIYAENQICKYMYDFILNHNKINIINNTINYTNPLIDFNKYDKLFKNNIINKIILDIHNKNIKPIHSMFDKTQNIFSKTCEVIEN